MAAHCHCPDCMLLIPSPLVFIYSHSKALFKLHCNMESVLFYWNVKKKEGCDWALLRFSPFLLFLLLLPVYSLLGYEYYDDMMTLFLSTRLFSFHLLILQ
ncbi:hypothetical protein GGI42DRAFT_106722 [Trichoderma sp. SZMC 28013]